MNKKVNFIYETKKWSIYDDGYNIKKYYKNIILSKYPLLFPIFIKKIHFGSINLLFKFKLLLPIIKILKIEIICSWFHIDDSEKILRSTPIFISMLICGISQMMK